MDRLLKYEWPGNVRELMNVMERAVVLSRSEYVDEDALPLSIQGDGEAGPADAPKAPPGANGRLADVERVAILETLKSAGGNKSEAARRLGITRRTLHKKLKKYGVME